MSKQAVNTFKQGLVMDLNPLANDNKSLTNALNATFITQNGNELMLQNDMGNGRINRVRLDDGYIPVGIKEYGGIIYVASYNPKTGKGQIGSFPYPKLEWEGSDFRDSTNIVLDQLYGDVSIKAKSQTDSSCILDFYEIKDDSVKLPLLVDSTGEQLKIRSGDSFSIQFDETTKQFLGSSTISVKLIVKTSSNYYTISDDKVDIINGKTFVYGGSYSGYVYLQIDLLIYNNFEVDYILNSQGATIYPRAFRDDSDISSKAVVLKHEVHKEDYNNNSTNLKCDLTQPKDNNSITVFEDGVYSIYPVTSDGGYIENLERKLNISHNFPCNSNVAQFKYYLENSTLSILFEYQTLNDNYNSSGNITYIYRLYPIKVINESIKSISDLNNLYKTRNYIAEVQRKGYTTKTGIRYFEVNLTDNDIYLLTVSCKENQNNENVLFTRFVYGTSRYNDFYNTYDDYNLIPRKDVLIDYTLSSNVFQPRLQSMQNYHRLVNGNWVPVDQVIRYSEEPITTEDPNYPEAFKTVFDIILEKTTDMYTECIPEDTYLYILDSESFSIPTKSISITINNWYDNPQKYSNNTLYTSESDNTVKPPHKENNNQSFVFHRYISSESNDNIIQQDRLVKTMAPVFNSKNVDDQLIGYSYTNNYMDVVIASKKFLSNICSRVLNPLIKGSVQNISKNDIGTHSYLQAEESLTGENGSVKLSNLQAALLGHSQETTNGISIFDIFAGGNSTDSSGDEDKFRDAADKASLRIRRTLNNNENAGIAAPQSDEKEINADDDWMIATCLNIKGKPMPITLASRCINNVFSTGTFVGEYTNKTGELIQVTSTNENNRPQIKSNYLKEYTYVNVGKKLQCFLSQIFTLQDLQKNIYLVGPSLNVLNYNVQDTSYFEYNCSINSSNNTFTQGLDTILDNLSKKLKSFNSCDDNCYPKNYIGSVKGNTLSSLYNYGHLVNLDSSLFNHILSQYENAYDNDEPLDESNGRTDEEIYFLNAEKLKEKSNFSTNSSTTELWENSGIYFNPEYHCFEYDLGKFDFSNYTKQSKISNPYDCMFDWTGRWWKFSPIVNNFITVFKAQRDYSNILSKLTNNYILLNRITTDVKTQWTVSAPDTNGPGLVYIDFGLRGLCKTKNSTKYTLENINNNTNYNSRAKRIADIINEYEFNRLKEEGFYETQT